MTARNQNQSLTSSCADRAIRNRNGLRILASLVVFLYIFSTTHSYASEAPITECDRLAAHPYDPDRVTRGVGFAELNTDVAIDACVAALQQFPMSARLAFQAGRSFHRLRSDSEAIAFYEQAAELGSVYAVHNLASLYADKAQEAAATGPSDQLSEYVESGISWARRSIALGDEYSRLLLGANLILRNKNDDRRKGVEILKAFSEQGELDAIFLLGDYYLVDEENYEQALYYYLAAAKRDHAVSQRQLGMIYEYGWGVEQDLVISMGWYHQSAEGGDAESQYRYAEALRLGLGAQADLEQAFFWYEESAENNFQPAIEFVLHAYRAVLGYALIAHSTGITFEGFSKSPDNPWANLNRSFQLALGWFVKRAKQDDPESLLVVGVFYSHGIYTDVNRELGLELLQKAAALGAVGAQAAIDSVGEGM